MKEFSLTQVQDLLTDDSLSLKELTQLAHGINREYITIMCAVAAHAHRNWSNGDKMGYDSIEEWAILELGWKRRTLYNYLTGFKVIQNLKVQLIAHTPNRLTHLLALAPYVDDARTMNRLWKKAIKSSEGIPTVVDLKKIIDEYEIEKAQKELREMEKKASQNFGKTGQFEDAHIEGMEWQITNAEKAIEMISSRATPTPPPREDRNGDSRAEKTYWTISEYSPEALPRLVPSSDLTMNAINDYRHDYAKWSWNPITGCEFNCPFCYARDFANGYYEQGFQSSVHPYRMKAPYNTPLPEDKLAVDQLEYKNVIVCQMGDMFGPRVPDEWIDAVLSVCRDNPQWNFIIQTRDVARARYFRFAPNIWLGGAASYQREVDNVMQHIEGINAGVKFLCIEPLLEEVTVYAPHTIDWLIIGGAETSSQTPAFAPARRWVAKVIDTATRNGVLVYEKRTTINGVPTDEWMNRMNEWPNQKYTKYSPPRALRYFYVNKS